METDEPRNQSPLRTRPGSQVPAQGGLLVYARRVRTGAPASLRVSTAGLNFKEKHEGADM